MTSGLLDVLCCPRCGGTMARAEDGDGTVLRCAMRHDVPVVGGVPRFVSSANYATSFGLQWNRFRRTQLDSWTGLPIARERFFRESAWTPSELAGKRVLDAGCGAGRFTEVALSTGADVVAVDYSSAVDACFANLGSHPRLLVVQGDLYRLPVKPAAFDYVYCFGV